MTDAPNPEPQKPEPQKPELQSPEPPASAPAAKAAPRIARAPLSRYRAGGLKDGVSLSYGFAFRAMLFFGAPLLILVSLLAAIVYSGPGRAAGLFGVVFFGAALGVLYLAYRRSDEGVATRLGEDGLFMAHLGMTLPWERLGPAWVVETRQQYGATRQAMILLRDPEGAMEEGDAIARFLLGTAARAAGRSREAAGWGGPLTVELARGGAPAEDPEAERVIIEARLARLREEGEALGAIPVGAPLALHAGLTPDALAAIVNAETLKRRDAAAMSPAAGQAASE